MKKILPFILLILFTGIYSFAQKPEMVLVEGGEFFMGNDYSDPTDEKPEHKVSLDDFYISVYEVTFEEYDLFCDATGYDYSDDGGFGRGKLPAMNVSWDDAVFYCNWLSGRHGYDKAYVIKNDSNGVFITVDFAANGYRLPTEAEWEYAARGGSKSGGFAYCGSNDPKEIAWYSANSDGKPQETGKKLPNELGIYDMSGNAWEWCWDYYDKDYYTPDPVNNPTGPEKGINRVYRGGNFSSKLDFTRITKRFSLPQTMESGMIGIRLVRSNS